MIQYNYTMPLSSVNLDWMTKPASQYLFFDIETTGLSAARSDLYLIGYGTVTSNNEFLITLLFNDDGCSEPKMLTAFQDILTHFQYLVTYNGDTFDLPYIKEKYRQFRKISSLDTIISIDVYRRIRKYKKLLQMDSMHQSDLECFMGMKREEFHSGGLLIDIYQKYLHTKDAGQLELLLSHNKDDIFGLIYVSGMLGLPAFFEGNFEIETVCLTDQMLAVTLHPEAMITSFNFLYDDILLTSDKNVVTIELPVIYDTLRYFYKDYKNYYYLPMEHTAIHKDVACYVDDPYKEKARPETAFTSKESIFIKQYKYKASHIFKYDRSDKAGYLEIDDAFIHDQPMIKDYILNLFRQLKLL